MQYQVKTLNHINIGYDEMFEYLLKYFPLN